MGMSNVSGGSGSFWRVANHKFVRTVDADTVGAVSRVNANEKTVHEIMFNTVSGHITGLRLKVDENPKYKNKWVVTIKDGSETFLIDFPESGVAAEGILKRLPNIDVNEPVQLRVGSFVNEKSGLDQTWLVVDQLGDNNEWKLIDKAFANDELPALKPVEVNGETIWDKTERQTFFKGVVDAFSKSFDGGNSVAVVAETADDDLPF